MAPRLGAASRRNSFGASTWHADPKRQPPPAHDRPTTGPAPVPVSRPHPPTRDPQVAIPRVGAEEMREKQEVLAQASGLHQQDAAWLLSAFHWSLEVAGNIPPRETVNRSLNPTPPPEEFLPAARDGSLRSLLQQSDSHCDELLCTLAKVPATTIWTP